MARVRSVGVTKVSGNMQSSNVCRVPDFPHTNPSTLAVFSGSPTSQTPIDHEHLMEVLQACTDESHIALQVLRLDEDLNLSKLAKMYAMALEVSQGRYTLCGAPSLSCVFLRLAQVLMADGHV